MATLLKGILTINGGKSFLDNRLLVIDDPDCGGDQDCTSRRARDFFVDSGTPSGSTVTVCGDLIGNVIHMFRDNSKCQ